MGFFDSLFGTSDPSKGAMKYLDKIPGMAQNAYNPYIQAGNRQLPGLEEQYGQLMNDPGGRMNQIGAGYQQSPGFQFALQQALQGSGNAQAAGGMAGSPQHEQQNMGIATNLANQDYNQYLQNALGMYGEGLQGSQGLYNTGYNASNSMADMLANAYGSQANLKYAGGANQNTAKSGLWGGLLGAGAQLGTAGIMGGAGIPSYFMKAGLGQ
jgi:hypothetical protein